MSVPIGYEMIEFFTEFQVYRKHSNTELSSVLIGAIPKAWFPMSDKMFQSMVQEIIDRNLATGKKITPGE